MPLSLKEKELAAVGISVAAGCVPCTKHHLTMARQAGAADDDIRHAVADAIAVRRHATRIMEAQSLGRPGVIDDAAAGTGAAGDRTRELVAVGAAFAVNCTTTLEAHLAIAKDLGIADNELNGLVNLARYIKERAASHVEALTQRGAAASHSVRSTEPASVGCCGA